MLTYCTQKNIKAPVLLVVGPVFETCTGFTKFMVRKLAGV